MYWMWIIAHSSLKDFWDKAKHQKLIFDICYYEITNIHLLHTTVFW